MSSCEASIGVATRTMMLQFISGSNRPEEAAMAASRGAQRESQNECELRHEDDEQEDEALAREQIKKMMNKMQDLHRRHQEQQQQQQKTSMLSAAVESGATNVCDRRRQLLANCRRPSSESLSRSDHETTPAASASHELIKRRFFEKLERRSSVSGGNPKTPTQGPLAPMRSRPSFASSFTKLGNLREESEYAYGFAGFAASGSTTTISRSSDSSTPPQQQLQQQPDAGNCCEIFVGEQSNYETSDYLKNNQLFVCDSGISSTSASAAQNSPSSCASPTAPTTRPKFDELAHCGGADITCKVKNDNALTRLSSPEPKEAKEAAGGGGGGGEEEAVYLTLDWKNVQVNELEQQTVGAQDRAANREQSEPKSRAFVGAGQQAASPALDLLAEQKQIKAAADPKAAEANANKSGENNKPQQLARPKVKADLHGQYKEPVSVGQRRALSMAASAGRRETQVLVVGGREQQRPTNEADLVILPEKSVNSNIRSGWRTKQLHKIPGLSHFFSSASLRKNGPPRKSAPARKADHEGRSSRSRARYHDGADQEFARRCARSLSSSNSSSNPSSFSSSCSSLSSSSSSSGLTASPSSGSLRSLELSERLHKTTTAAASKRLEQLSVSEDDLKSLISRSNHSRCCAHALESPQRRRHLRALAASNRKQERRQRRLCHSPDDDDDRVSPESSRTEAAAAAAAEDEAASLKKCDDSSNSSSGNSSATRSLMNSLFNRMHQQQRQATQRQNVAQATNLIAQSHSSSIRSKPVSVAAEQLRTDSPSRRSKHSSSSRGKIWSLFSGPIGASHASKPLPALPGANCEPLAAGGACLRPPSSSASASASASERQREASGKQTSDGREQIYAAAMRPTLSLEPRTAGYRLAHLPGGAEARSESRSKSAARNQAAEQTYVAGTNISKQYHSCARHQHRHHSHHHHHHLSHSKHRGRNHRHHHHHHHHHDRRSSSGHSRHAHSRERRAPAASEHAVRGQLIEINHVDGSQTVELERLPASSWGFFVARGSINSTKGIFISRVQEQQRRRRNEARSISARPRPTAETGAATEGGEAEEGAQQLAGLLGVGDQLLAIDEHQIGPDYDILRVNRLIGRRSKILLKVKPFKG